jgi:hypothetical protein
MLLGAPVFCRVSTAETNAQFPAQITASNGKVYTHTTKLNVYPDGILVSYSPAPRAVGLAKLKFRDLPEALQKQYGYDPKAAAEFEQRQAQATEELKTRLAAEDPFAKYRKLAELNQLLGGSQATSYSVLLDTSGKVSAQAVTGNPPSPTVTNVGAPGYLPSSYGNGVPPDYMQPMPTGPYPNR